jgi:hypothetical protein
MSDRQTHSNSPKRSDRKMQHKTRSVLAVNNTSRTDSPPCTIQQPEPTETDGHDGKVSVRGNGRSLIPLFVRASWGFIHQPIAMLLGVRGKRQSPMVPEPATVDMTSELPEVVKDPMMPDGLKPKVKPSHGRIGRAKTPQKAKSKRSSQGSAKGRALGNKAAAPHKRPAGPRDGNESKGHQAAPRTHVTRLSSNTRASRKLRG